MKKIFALLLALAMVLALTACNSTTTEETAPAPVETVEEVEETVTEKFPVYGCRYYPETGEIVTADGEVFGVENPEILNYDGEAYEGIPVAIGVKGDPANVESWEILGVVYDRETAIYDELEAAFNEELDGYEVERTGNHITINKE